MYIYIYNIYVYIYIYNCEFFRRIRLDSDTSLFCDCALANT